MKQTSPVLTTVLLVLSLAAQLACSTAPPANTNQSSSNQPAANANTTPSNASASKPAAQADNTTGTIEVTSVPPGASVVLIATDDDTASEPQQKGSTPTTITGVKPGNYTVHLERLGYRFFQRNVKISAGKTVRINAPLKKQ